MGTKTGISWTDATWNPIRGCSRVSEGCRNCYAEGIAYRFSGPGMPFEGLVQLDMHKSGAITRLRKWNGKIKFVEEHLLDPLKWKKTRRIFVNSMSDLFHENVTDETWDTKRQPYNECPVCGKPTSSPLGQQELLPCPFCGSEKVSADRYIRDGREVVCRTCQASVGAFNPDANKKAIEKWNRRVNPTPVSPLGQQEPDGIGWCSSCDKVHEVRRPKCPICDDWLIFAADDKPSVEGHNEGIDAAINFLHEWNKRGDYIQSAGFFASKLATVKKATNPTPVSVGGEETKK